MKCLTVKQPWAWLLVNGYKDIENRSWPTKHRGPLLIHAAQQPRSDIDEIRQGIKRRFRIDIPVDLPRGGIVGKVNVVDCVTKSRSRWFEGDYGFVCAHARRLRFTPMKGRLGIYEVPTRAERSRKGR
jgi:ASCH domain-containing protein